MIKKVLDKVSQSVYCNTVYATRKNSDRNVSLYALCYAKACNEFAGPVSAPLRPGNTAFFEQISQRWRAVGNSVFDLTGPRFEIPASETNALPPDLYIQQLVSPTIGTKGGITPIAGETDCKIIIFYL